MHQDNNFFPKKETFLNSVWKTIITEMIIYWYLLVMWWVLLMVGKQQNTIKSWSKTQNALYKGML